MELTAVNQLVDIIRDIVRQETNDIDRVAVARITAVKPDGLYDLYVEPDEKTILHDIPSITASIKKDDYVYVYKVTNRLNNSFIIKKIGSVPKEEQFLTRDELYKILNNFSISSGGSGGEPSGTVINIETGVGLTGGPITTSGTISHADTSSQTSVTNTGTTYIQSVSLDDFGHVTGLSSGTYTEPSYSLGSGGTTNGTAKIVLKKNANEVSSQIIDGDKDIEVIYNSSNTRLRVQHTNSTIAKTAYTATGTGTVSANGGQIKITDFKYDAYGHVTDSETNTITLSQVLNTAGSTNLGATKLYLVGASTQAANPQTYSNSLTYVGTDNNLYTQSTTAGSSARVITAGDTGSVTSTMLANSGVTAGTYCAVTVNDKGLVTAGGHVVEIGTVVDAGPDNLLVNGGLFFRLIEE